MKILLLAPHPFFQERGTPIAVDLMLRVLSEAGHQVEVVTYHEGEDVTYPGVQLFRISAPPGIRDVRPGFSAKKLVCDAWLFFRAWGRIRRFRPDILHAVEESAFMARFLGWLYRIPYIYDMDSSLSQQLTDKKPGLRFLLPIFRRMERGLMRGAITVVPVCRSLADIAGAYHPTQIVLLPDITLLDGSDAAPATDLRPTDGLRVMYIGNLEAYQGIDLLLQAFSLACQEVPDLTLTVVGGTDEAIGHYRDLSESLGISKRVEFAGPRPVAELAAYMAAADILASPRIQGNNTPMKIYSYLDSGKPVLATDLPTHTQVLNDSIGALATPGSEAYALALVALAGDEDRRRDLGRAARIYVREHHSYASFSRILTELYAQLAVRVVCPGSDQLRDSPN